MIDTRGHNTKRVVLICLSVFLFIILIAVGVELYSYREIDVSFASEVSLIHFDSNGNATGIRVLDQDDTDTMKQLFSGRFRTKKMKDVDFDGWQVVFSDGESQMISYFPGSDCCGGLAIGETGQFQKEGVYFGLSSQNERLYQNLLKKYQTGSF